MTAPTVNTPATSSAGSRSRSAQWAVMARMLSIEGLRSLLITTGVVLLVLAVSALIARWRGWHLVGMTETDTVGLQVIADQRGVTIIASLFILPAAVGIAAAVMAIVLAARTRVYVATGATRRAVAAGHLLAILVMTGYTLLVTAVVLLVVGRGFEGARGLLQADGAGDVVLLGVRAVGAVLLALTAASAITALFLRWPWWVGTGVLILVFAVVPLVAVFLLSEVVEAVNQVTAWWGWDLTLAALSVGVYWWILRRVPVR